MMFSSERMNKFGLSVQPVTEYAKGGGGGYGGPPPRDWSPEWRKVQDASTEATKQVSQITDEVKTTKLDEDWRTKQARINSEIGAAIAKIDEAINLDYQIPTSWFGDSAGQHSAAVSNLKSAKENLQSMIDRRAPTAYDLIKDELVRETLQLQATGRVIGSQVSSAAVDNVYPADSWQHKLWLKGYTLDEIGWLEDDIAVTHLDRKTHGNKELFALYAEDELDRAILDGSVKQKVNKEILTVPVQTQVDPATLPVTITDGLACIPYRQIPVPPGTDLAGTGVAVWRRRQIRRLGLTRFRGIGIPDSGYSERYARGWGYDNGDTYLVYDTNGNLIDKKYKGLKPPRYLLCGSTGAPWVDYIMGAGATPAEVQTVSDMILRSRYPAGTDMNVVALSLLTTLRANTGTDADTNANNYSNQPVDPGPVLANPYAPAGATNVPNPLEVLIAHNRARKQTQRARRAAIR